MFKYIAIALLSGSTMLAMANPKTFTPFTTLQQAEQNCPATNGLTFTPTNPSIPHSQGMMHGANPKSQAFSSLSPVMAPGKLPVSTQFRNVNGNYGYNSNGVISCFYTYQGFTGINVALMVRS